MFSSGFTNDMSSVYLDTNVISGLAKGEYPENISEALVHVTVLSKDGRINLYTSEITADELALIPARYRRQHVVVYNLIKNVAQPAVLRVQHQYFASSGRIFNRGRGLIVNSELIRELEALIPTKRNPGKVQARSRDIAHLHRFRQSGLDYFLTEDRRSILCHRDRLLELGIRAVSSIELLAELK